MSKLHIYRILLAIALWAGCFMPGARAAANEPPAVDVQAIVFSHIQDNYTWHITSWQGHAVAIPLPVLVWSKENGWHCFLSSRLEDGRTYAGFRIAADGAHAGKIVERDAAGGEVRPVDLSLTKDVVALLLSCLILSVVILRLAAWYKRHPLEAPGGFVGMMEACICFVYDGVVRDSIGEGYKRYGPYLLTLFFFILLNNLMGLIPIFPGGANVTGNIAITLVLALTTFFIVNLSGTKRYWKEVFWPDTPIFLKLPLPLMPFVEFFGVFTKPFALMIRLFANIMAGHTIILGLTCLVFISVAMGAILNGAMSLLSVLFCVFMNCIELLVAGIQAYVFTLLSAVYIGLAREK